jgi:hypothetical protein
LVRLWGEEIVSNFKVQALNFKSRAGHKQKLVNYPTGVADPNFVGVDVSMEGIVVNAFFGGAANFISDYSAINKSDLSVVLLTK